MTDNKMTLAGIGTVPLDVMEPGNSRSQKASMRGSKLTVSSYRHPPKACMDFHGAPARVGLTGACGSWPISGRTGVRLDRYLVTLRATVRFWTGRRLRYSCCVTKEHRRLIHPLRQACTSPDVIAAALVIGELISTCSYRYESRAQIVGVGRKQVRWKKSCRERESSKITNRRDEKR